MNFLLLFVEIFVNEIKIIIQSPGKKTQKFKHAFCHRATFSRSQVQSRTHFELFCPGFELNKALFRTN